MPLLLRRRALALVRRLTRIDEIDDLLASHADTHGAAFLDTIFAHLDFSVRVSSCDNARIPAKGRLIIVANHPLGAMDALALLRVVLDVRSDVHVVVNQLLMQVESLTDHFLPFDMFAARPRKKDVAAMRRALEREAALLIFPSGDVSRMTRAGLRDRRWFGGAAHLAHKYDAPVLPVFIGGRNSWLFYPISFLSRTIGVLLLPRQIFRQRGKTLRLRIGDPIPARAFSESAMSRSVQIERLRQHVYELGTLARRESRLRPGHRAPVSYCVSEPALGASARSRARYRRETNA
ncbi:MAG: 1-acyl-sn-glycerol-3-phosphate acyltransferase [Vicinamibacterales bacterium]